MSVLACNTWATNAELIADVSTLYLRHDDEVLDLTYGRGVWWRRHRPASFVSNDRHTVADLGYDFRRLPMPDRWCDVVAYDPPYVSIGGRKGSKMASLHAAFGLIGAPRSPAEMQYALINPGLTEAARVARRLVLVKCQDYISSGRLWPGTHLTLSHAMSIGMRLVDRFEHVAGVRPQPTLNPDGSTRRQVHARRNLSTLFVLEVAA